MARKPRWKWKKDPDKEANCMTAYGENAWSKRSHPGPYPTKRRKIMATNHRPRILIWDIESTGLNATFGTILCIGWKWHGEKKVHCPTILETNRRGMLDDTELVKQFTRAYEECDYHVTWYGDRFDLPMVQSKLLKAGLGALPQKPSLDLWRTARRALKLHSNRLAVVQEWLGVEHAKTAINFDDWLRAAHGDKKALAEVVNHCKLDVIVLEEVFDILRPLVREEPARRLFVDGPEGCCVTCGSNKLKPRGFQVARTRRYQRYRCDDCGKWMRVRTMDKTANVDLIGGW